MDALGALAGFAAFLYRAAEMTVGTSTLAEEGGDGVEAELRRLLTDVLSLPPERVAAFDNDTALFGALPEFDSLAVANFLTAFEERFDVLIEDDDVEAEDFADFGALLAFTRRITER